VIGAGELRAGSTLEPAVDRASLDAWEAEGGQVRLPSRRRGRGNGLHGSEAFLPDGLSWEEFCALVFPDQKRHYFAAIAPWYRYGDGDRSWPRTKERFHESPATG
jgi:hypothetical protein